jgi:hypothetical protein
MRTPDPLADPRFDDLIEELRDARITTPARLTELVEDLAGRPAPPAPAPPLRDRVPRLRRPGWNGRVAAIGLGLLVLGTLVAFAARGGESPSSGSSSQAAASYGGGAASSAAAAPAMTTPLAPGKSVFGTVHAASPESGDALVASGSGDFQSPQRLQHENVQLRVALADVGAVSDATTDVTRAIQGYGGYVVTLGFDAASSGQSTIVAKVPFPRIQEAIGRFSALGHVVSEHVDLTDLQKQYDSVEQQLARADLQIARLRARLTDSSLTPSQVAGLRVRLATAVAQRADLRRSAQATRQSAAMADLALDLVTRQVAAAKTSHKGGLGGAAGAAVSVLGAVGRAAVFVTIVAAPLVVIALAILAGRRSLRVRRERRLLEGA